MGERSLQTRWAELGALRDVTDRNPLALLVREAIDRRLDQDIFKSKPPLEAQP